MRLDYLIGTLRKFAIGANSSTAEVTATDAAKTAAEAAAVKLSNYFGHSASDYDQSISSSTIDDLIESAKEAKKICIGKKPSIGLESPSTTVEEAESNLTKTEEEAQINNDAAEAEICETKAETDSQINAAEAETSSIQEEAIENNNSANEQVNEAKDNTEAATESLRECNDTVSEAETAFQEAEQEIEDSEGNEEAQANAEANAAEAKQALETAKAEQEIAEQEVDNAEKAEIKAEETRSEVQEEGEKNVIKAKEKEEEVKIQAEEAIQKVEQEAKEIKAKGEEDIKEAKDSLEKAKENTSEASSKENEFSRKDEYYKNKEALKAQGTEIANDIIKELDNGKKADISESLDKITSENVVHAIDALKENNQGLGIADTISAGSTSKEARLENLDSVIMKMNLKAEQYGVDTEELMNKYDKITISSNGNFSSKELEELNKIYDDLSNEIKTQETSYEQRIEKVENYLSTAEKHLKDICTSNEGKSAELKFDTEYFKQVYKPRMDDYKLDPSKVTADGNFNGDSLQMLGNCWLHAGINAMTATEAGSAYVNKLVENENGITTAVIPEAILDNIPGNEEKVFNNDGILGANAYHSLGDGDMAAYSSAVKSYFKSNPEAAAGQESFRSGMDIIEANGIERAFELISGEKVLHYKDENIPFGIGKTNGITTSLYDDMQKILSGNKGAFAVIFDEKFDCGSLVDKQYQDTEGKPFLTSGHAYAVKRVVDDFVYLQESNNPATYIKLSKEDFIEHVEEFASFIFRM